MSLQATIDFRLKTLADPASPPSGWALGTGSNTSKYQDRGEVGWESAGTQALWYNTTVMQGNVIESEVTAGLLVSVSIGAAIVDINGNGYMAINTGTASSLRLFLVVASQLSGSALVTVNLPMVTGQRIMLRRTISPSNNYEILVDGVSQGSYNAPATYDPKYGACVSRYGSVRQVDLYYTPNQTVTSINGGNPITANQTTVSSVTTGFTGLPTSITCDLAGITCSSIGGTTNAPTFVKSQRVNGQPWPLNGATATFTYVNGSESASGTQVIQKEAGDVVYTFSGVINDDPASIGYWLTQDGFTVEGGEHSYTPYGDLVLTADGGGTVTDAGTFTSWFRPAAGTGAGNVYYYEFTINDGGITPSSSGGLTSAGLTSSGLTRVGLTSSGL